MFHAVSLGSDVELAKVLAFSAPALRSGVARVENAELELTAIVEPLPERALARARESAGPDGVVLATGSIYLVADLLRGRRGGIVSTL